MLHPIIPSRPFSSSCPGAKGPAAAIARQSARALAAYALFVLAGTHSVQAQACEQDRDCASTSNGTTSSGTISWCHQSRCVTAQRNQSSCRYTRGTPRCFFDESCDDADASTVNWCAQERCHRAPRNGNGICTAPSSCTRDRDCRDNDAATQDWCNQGQCVNARRDQLNCQRSGTSCTVRTDCIDGDRGTIDWCHQGVCAQAPRASTGQCEQASCAPVQVVIESSRRGAVNNPASEDRRWKVAFNSYQIRYVRGRTRNGPLTLSYHCFELNQVRGQILSAQLEMAHSDNTYESRDPSETVIFRPIDRVPCDAALDRSVFSAPPNYQAIFDDLDDGPVLAQFEATLSDRNKLERFDVNATGIASLQSRAGSSNAWGIGGGLSTADATTGGEIERVFRGTDSSTDVFLPQAKLILQVLPEGCQP